MGDSGGRMKINYRTVEKLNEIYLHDAVFEGFNYDYEKKQVIIEMAAWGTETERYDRRYRFTFFNTLGIEVLAGDFWGPTPHVYDWETVSGAEGDFVKKIINEDKFDNLKYRIENIEYILNTTIEISSGDKVKIVCETIEVEKTVM